MSMRRLALELTNRCNLDCRHCLRDSRRTKHDLPLPLIRRLLQQAKRLGVSQVAFTGGEPLLHPHWQEILRLTAKQGYQFSLVTNGHRLPQAIPFLSRPALRKKLLRIAISLDGPDASSHDAIRGRGSFRKVMAAIAAGYAHGLPLRLKFTVTRQSVERVEEMVLLAAHLGLEGIEVSHMFPTPDNLRAQLMLTPEEWRQVESKVQRLAQELKILVGMCAGGYDPNPFFLCGSLNLTELYVDSRGNLALCCMLPALRGSDPARPEPELIADLAQVELFAAHLRLVDVIADFFRRRLRQLQRREPSELEHFQCLACARYFGKLEWLREFPQSPWSALVLPGKEMP
jgi:MoaA/NifB/PqqE/SkfB family radical SAM enzyme